ncbi:MAG: hypothetical protein ACERKD_11895 [Prolixibacteraceae bacterium]
MKTKILLFLLVVIFNSSVWGQSSKVADKVYTDRIDSLLSDVLFGEGELANIFGLKKEYQFLYLRSNIDSKTFYAGREIGMNQYNISNQIFYLNSNGIYAGISGTWYSQLDPNYRTTILKLGYGKAIQNHPGLRYRTSFDYYVFHEKEPEYESPYFGSWNGGLTLKTKSLGTRFDAAILLGSEFDSQLNWSAFGYLNIAKFGAYSKIRLEPEISLFFGNEVAAYDLGEGLIDPVTNIVYNSYYKESFGLMNVQLELPLAITFKNLDLNISYQYNIPRTSGDLISYPNSSFLRFSVGYMFSL